MWPVAFWCEVEDLGIRSALPSVRSFESAWRRVREEILPRLEGFTYVDEQTLVGKPVNVRRWRVKDLTRHEYEDMKKKVGEMNRLAALGKAPFRFPVEVCVRNEETGDEEYDWCLLEEEK